MYGIAYHCTVHYKTGDKTMNKLTEYKRNCKEKCDLVCKMYNLTTTEAEGHVSWSHSAFPETRGMNAIEYTQWQKQFTL